MKNFLKITVSSLLSIGLLIGCSNNSAENSTSNTYKRPEVKTSSDSLKILKEGNSRMTSGKTLQKDLSAESREVLSTKGQSPFAVVLSCSDSRVPPELIFDQGVGDLFVIRNAGNVVDTTTLGSIEYGAYKLNSPLIVVLGHEQCGAVDATVKGNATNTNIDSIIDNIKPVFSKVNSANSSKNTNITTETEDENIRYQMDKIKSSATIKKLIEQNKVNIVGAKYDLNTGKVTFLE